MILYNGLIYRGVYYMNGNAVMLVWREAIRIHTSSATDRLDFQFVYIHPISDGDLFTWYNTLFITLIHFARQTFFKIAAITAGCCPDTEFIPCSRWKNGRNTQSVCYVVISRYRKTEPVQNWTAKLRLEFYLRIFKLFYIFMTKPIGNMGCEARYSLVYQHTT